MPLIPYADLESLPPEFRARFGDKGVMNLARMWLNSPPSFASGFEFVRTLLWGGHKLDPALRELVIMAAARIEGGVYEWAQHDPIALKAGVRREQLDALLALRFDDPAFDDKERALLRLALEIARKVAADVETVERAKRFFSAQDIVEIIIVTGFYMTMARLTETTRVEVDPPPGVAVPDFARVGDAELATRMGT